MSHEYPREAIDTVRGNEKYADAGNGDLRNYDDPHDEPLVIDKDGSTSVDQDSPN